MQSKRRIVILNDQAYINGGAPAVAIASAIGLAETGEQVSMLTAVGPISPQLIDVPNLQVHCLDQHEIVDDPNRLRALRSGIANREAAARVTQLLIDCDPKNTIVHVHSWMKALSPLAIHAATRRGFKVLVTMHDFFITCPTGGFFLPKEGTVCSRVPLSASCVLCSCDRRNYLHKLWRSARTFYQNRILHIPAGIAHYVAVSEFSASVVRPYLPKEAAITTVRNPVDCQDHGPSSVSDNEYFLFIGRFTQEKGVLVAAEACRRAGVKAVFVGDGELSEKAKSICPDGQFTGWIKPQEVHNYLRKSRAILFPPLWYETLGLVVIEAAAAGIPAIVPDRSAAADLVKDGHSGLHFEYGSVESMANRIQQLRDKELAMRLGKAAYDWYWENPWDKSSHVRELMTLYDRVLA